MPIQKTTPEEIIKKSIQVFRRKGYYRTTMSDLAKETGLTKGAFYHHFENKETVMRKALQATSTWFHKKIFSIAFTPNLSDKEKLTQMSAIAFRAFTDDEGGCFFANTILETAHVEDTFLDEINTFFNNWEQAFSEVFKAKIPEPQREDFVQQLIAEIEGSIILMQLHKNDTYLKKAFARIMNRID